ncbi:hypothetical protein CYY_003974 [Polysphondylium violaceum]|uniref:NAD(+) ADP-ribosyltransferase n=1 Tax=Polysphondylium violaceum TaxID=133409 RepID=A0A8J4V0S3_9MYCE|nr:hypothetical protein CYY_003974 [Polysphondylium violaceum]
MLKEYLQFNSKKNNNNTSNTNTSSNNNTAISTNVINEKSPMFFAISNGSFALAKELLYYYLSHSKETKFDVNEADDYGYTPLHMASNGDDEMIMALLNCEGINVNLCNRDKNTPFHYFCQKYRYPNCNNLFKKFIEKGTDINALNHRGETPLHKAILNSNVRLIMVNVLLEYGADVNIMTTRGDTPLHYAIHLEREDLVEALIQGGADISLKERGKKTCYEVALEVGNQKVIETMKKYQDLYDWLKNLDLEQYFEKLVRNDFLMGQMHQINEQVLNSLNIQISGHRLKFIKHCGILKLKLERAKEKRALERIQ